MTNKPVRKLRDGAIEVVAWANEKGWTWNIKKSYKNKDGDWVPSTAWWMSDLKKLRDLLTEAIEGGEDDEEKPKKKGTSFDDDSLPGVPDDPEDIPF